jgi:hypothetical protein
MSFTPDEVARAYEVLGLGSPEEIEQRDADFNERAKTERLADLVQAGEEAVEQGRYTPAEVAAYLLTQGETAAHQVFVDRWADSESSERAEEQAWEISNLSAPEWQARAEAIQAENEWQLESALEKAQEDLARAQLEELTSSLRDHIATTPGAHADAERLANRLREKVIETLEVPDDEAGRSRLVQTAAHEIAVADEVVAPLREQARVETRLKAKTWARTGEVTTRAAWDKKLADAEEERFQELLETTPVSPSALQLPPTSADETARMVERISSKNKREQDFNDQVSRAKGSTPGDSGTRHTEDRKAFRDALRRAEETATWGAPRSAATIEEPKPKTGIIDDAGDAFGHQV